MKRLFRMALIVLVATALGGVSQVGAQAAKSKHSATPVRGTAPVPVAVQQPAQQTWYEKAFAKINPDDLDYGAWLEQRRRAFLHARVANPYFEYSFWLTVLLFGVGGAAIKLQMDKTRVIRVTAEAMVDLRNQELLSNAAANEAIRRHNEHMEACNRAFALEKAGPQSSGFPSATLDSELKRVREEHQRANLEIVRLTQDNEAKSKTLASLSLRLEGLGGPGAQIKGAPSDVNPSNADTAGF